MDPKEDFACALGKVARDWRTRFDNELRALDLTCARALALRQLNQARQPVTQTHLACELGIEHPTCVRLVDGLESQGLVTRRSTGSDRRVKHLLLTKAGRRLAGMVERRMRALRLRYLKGVGDNELDTATRVLAVIADNLQAADVEAVPA